MWMPHYNANTINKESYPREIWIGYNIELAEQVYLSHMSKDGLGFNFDRIIIIINRIINHISNNYAYNHHIQFLHNSLIKI